MEMSYLNTIKILLRQMHLLVMEPPGLVGRSWHIGHLKDVEEILDPTGYSRHSPEKDTILEIHMHSGFEPEKIG